MENKKVIVSLVLILILVMAIYISRGDDVPLLTPEQVALNYSQFFSIKHNEPDVKEGEFRLFPWKNEAFRIYSEAIPEIREKETTKKEESDGGRKLTISTETAYWFEPFYLGPDEPQQIKMIWKDEEITVPVYIKVIVSRSSIEQNSAKYLSNLTEGSHLYKLRVASPIGGNSTKFNPNVVFERLPNISARNLRYLPDILEYSTTEAWLGQLRKMVIWELLEDPTYRQTIDRAREETQKRVGDTVPPFSPTVLVDNDIIFTIPVIIEEINGVKIKYHNG